MTNSVLIADDSEAIRCTLRNLFSKHSDLTICGEAEDGCQAVEKARKLRPDLILLDFSMPNMNGLEAAAQLKDMNPGVPIVMLTMFKDRFLEDRAYKAGINLVLSKEENMARVADYARILLKPDTPRPA